MMRSEPYSDSHRASTRGRGDRIAGKPTTLRALLRWAQTEYAKEPPPRLHGRDTAENGAPDHSGQAKTWLGLDYPKSERDPAWTAPDDTRKTACRLDGDGSYQFPLRCAVERVPGDERRRLLRAVLPNVFFPSEAAKAAGIPDWCADDVLFRALSILWDQYRDAPLPQRSRKSDAQMDAEAA
jgi:hypothetical protein